MKPGNTPIQLKPAHPRVIIKLTAPLPEESDVRYARIIERNGVLPWTGLANDFQGIALAKLFTQPAQNRFRGVRATVEMPPMAAVDIRDTYYVVECGPNTDAEALAERLRNMPTVEKAYLESGPMPPPKVDPITDPYFMEQGYLGPAPLGIDAMYAWNLPGGDGEGTSMIDVEQGWNHTHEDLVGAHVQLVHGFENDFHGHGTAVLGQIGAVDNAIGCIGIAPRTAIRLSSQWIDQHNYSTTQAIDAAARLLLAGDVMLLEAQFSYPSTPNTFLPVEVEETVFLAIRAATAKGIVVVEAGGNGTQDLDAYHDPATGRFVLNRNHADFMDSGAIIVGAASAAMPHQRLWFSNYGSRIDCYAWGDAIRTTGDGWRGLDDHEYTPDFGGTSGASPIITGVVLCLQGIFRKRHAGRVLDPTLMRALLSDGGLGTPSYDPAVDRIGSMPDIKKLCEHLGWWLNLLGKQPSNLSLE
ncbi:MAG: S8 family peptidase [Flavobacteriales bacterium]